jgi:hypothetical protein
MRRLAIVTLGTASLVVLQAATALAQDGSAIPPGEVGPQIITRPTSQTSGIAFAGAEITVWMVLAASLFVAGVAFLIAGRRRLRSASNAN